jgi:NADH:ubiquinone oxidoreductase subunit E
MGTACYVRGGKEALERLERHLGVPVDSMTEDRRFSLEQVRCLGACGVAPVVVVDEGHSPQGNGRPGGGPGGAIPVGLMKPGRHA